MTESYANVVPEEIQYKLMALQDSDKKNSFSAGDLTNEVLAMRSEISADKVYRACGLFLGRAARTVREYAAISKFYPDHVRQEYSVLSFEHFRIAMRLGSRWQEALEWAVAQTDSLNRPATVDSMELQYSQDQSHENYEVGDREDLKRIIGKLQDLRDDAEERIAKLINQAIEKLEQAVVELV